MCNTVLLLFLILALAAVLATFVLSTRTVKIVGITILLLLMHIDIAIRYIRSILLGILFYVQVYNYIYS